MKTPFWKLAGFFLLCTGVLVLSLATPTDNVVGEKFKSLTFSVSKGNTTPSQDKKIQEFQNLSDHVSLFINFNITLSRYLNCPTTPKILLTTNIGDSGPSFFCVNNLIQVSLPTKFDGQNLAPLSPINSLKGEKVNVKANFTNNQSWQVWINGRLSNAFTYDKPFFNNSPQTVKATPSQDFSISKVTLSIKKAQSSNFSGKLLVRSVQIIGLIFIAAGLAILLRRFFESPLIIESSFNKKSASCFLIVLTLGELFNLAVILFYHQKTNNVYWTGNTWLFSPYPRFSDFFQVRDVLITRNPYGILGGNYPPLGYVVLLPFVWLKSYAGVFVMLISCSVFFLCWIRSIFYKHFGFLMTILFSLVIFLSLPVSYLIDRGNILFPTFCLLVLVIKLLERSELGKATFVVGIISAIKLYPVFYTMLLVKKVKKKTIFLNYLSISLVSVLVLLFFDEPPLKSLLNLGKTTFALGSGSVNGFLASFQGWIDALFYIFHNSNGLSVPPSSSPLNSFLLLAISLFLLYFYLRKIDQRTWVALTLIPLVFIAFIPSAYYYCLIFVIPGAFYFFKEETDCRLQSSIAVLFGLVLMPKSYYHFYFSIDTGQLIQFPLEFLLGACIIFSSYSSARRVTENKANATD